MTDFTLRFRWIDATGASGRDSLEGYGRSVTPSREEPLESLTARIVDLLEIDLVGVQTEHGRRGIAQMLLDELIEDETRAGLAEARLELAASSDPALGLYTGPGFMVVGRRTRYYPDGDDALLLSRITLTGRSVPPP